MEIGFRRTSMSLIVGLLFVFAATFAFGQGIVTGSISGTVEDQQHAVVAGANVTATNTATNQQFTSTSNSQGFFTIRGVPAGTYSVTIEAPKFTRLKMSDVVVNTSRDTALGARTLSIGTAEIVTVEAGAPLIETNSAQVSATFGSKAVADLPLYSGFDMLAYFTPGVVSAGSQGFSNNNGADISANGQRGRSNNFQIDGQSNNDNSVAGPSIFFSNQDAIAEFNVITNNFGVEYGRNSGTVVNYVTKSGTNAFHGTAFEYHTNHMFDSYANQEKSPLVGICTPNQEAGAFGPDGIEGTGDDVCARLQRLPKFIENRFGGTLGGPIWKDKAWFFGSYYGDRVRSGSTRTTAGALVPTPAGEALLAANFPNSPGVAVLQTYGPYAITEGNPRPVGDVSTVTVAGVPIPFAQVSRILPQPYNEHEASARGDIQITPKDRFFARYLFEKSIQGGATAGIGGFAAGAWVDVPAKSQQIALDWSRTWSQNFVNQARFSYSRAKFAFEAGSTPSCTVAAIHDCFTRINFTPGAFQDLGLANNLPQDRLVNNTQWQDNASWVHGRHTLKFGGEFDRQRSPSNFLPNVNGTYNFTSWTNFINNRPRDLNLADGPINFNFKEKDAAWYIGDDWRVKDNLTVNFGVRWEFFQQAVNLLHDLTVANLNSSSPFWNTSLPTNITTLPKIPEDKNNFAPMFGFAWTPHVWQGLFGQDKTVVRGGFRINYEPAYYNIFLNIATAAPVVNLGTINGPGAAVPGPAVLPPGLTGANVSASQLSNIPRGFNPGARNRTDVDPHFHNPYTENWHFGFERQLTNSFAAEVRYVGNHTVGNFQTINANPQLCAHRGVGPLGANSGACDLGLGVDFPNLVPAGVTMCNTVGTPNEVPGFAAGRADCAFSNVRRRTNTAFSIYHGLQTELRVRNWHGLTSGLSYTFSKTIDNVSEIFSTASGGNTVAGAQNPFDANFAERSLSGLDFRHAASLYLTYELPWYKNQQGFAGHLLGGWQLSPTWRYNVGQNYTPVGIASLIGAQPNCQPSFDGSFFGIDTCRSFTSNPNAPVDTIGLCTDATLPDCGLVDLNSGPTTANPSATPTPIAASQVHWIYNDATAATFFGTPFGNTRRNPGVRGQATNAVNMNIIKSTRVTEKVSLRFEAQAFNLFNHQFRGNPDPFVEDCSLAAHQAGVQDNALGFGFGCAGSYANNFFNEDGGDFSNVVINGIGRRRLVFGVKLIF